MTGTCIIYQNETGSLWITSLLLNRVIISLNSNIPPSKKSLYPCFVKKFLLFFGQLHRRSFHFFFTSIMFNSKNPLSWGWRDDSLKVLNMVIMEDVVKLSTRMRRLSPLSWCLCVVKFYHPKGGHYRLARFSAFRLSSLRSHKRGFKRETLCQWCGSENRSDEVAQGTLIRILRGRDTCSHSKVENYY